MKRILSTLAIFAIAIASCKKKPGEPPKTLPLVTTAALSNVNIGAGSATAGGSIVSDGGAVVTKSGIVWSPSNNTPTLTADSIVSGSATTGAFTINISGLDFGKSYYFRAFATNSIGTGYGDVVTLTTSSDSVRFTYNGQTVTYGIIVSSASGKKWMDRNLGAKRVATVITGQLDGYNDWQAYGDLFQWGRPADGHQLINWTSSTTGTAVNGSVGGSAGTVATSDVPGHSNFIIPPYDYPLDWRSGNNRNRWATIPQGPCPAGWHVPTVAEWLAEVPTTKGGTASSGGMTNIVQGYSQLKLTTGGERVIDGPGSVIFLQVNRIGHYWTSSDRFSAADNYSDARDFEIGIDGLQGFYDFKAMAKAVRCIKD